MPVQVRQAPLLPERREYRFIQDSVSPAARFLAARGEHVDVPSECTVADQLLAGAGNQLRYNVHEQFLVEGTFDDVDAVVRQFPGCVQSTAQGGFGFDREVGRQLADLDTTGKGQSPADSDGVTPRRVPRRLQSTFRRLMLLGDNQVLPVTTFCRQCDAVASFGSFEVAFIATQLVNEVENPHVRREQIEGFVEFLDLFRELFCCAFLQRDLDDCDRPSAEFRQHGITLKLHGRTQRPRKS
ncbi:hypothetical protein MBRU_16215 [Mycolicibacterium brumae DSM 44177]|nr:hypothetical protein MBRU_16215 [Mycolicibacterium brumae DSM 44177]